MRVVRSIAPILALAITSGIQIGNSWSTRSCPVERSTPRQDSSTGFPSSLQSDTQLTSKNALLVRYHLVGTFRFKGGYAPEPLDDACAKEAGLYAGQHGNRNPPFRADLCKAKQIQVNGSFDIVQDFPAKTL
jgi:hypothetical protein